MKDFAPPEKPWPGKQPDVAFYNALGQMLGTLGQGPMTFALGLKAFGEAMVNQGYVDPPE